MCIDCNCHIKINAGNFSVQIHVREICFRSRPKPKAATHKIQSFNQLRRRADSTSGKAETAGQVKISKVIIAKLRDLEILQPNFHQKWKS